MKDSELWLRDEIEGLKNSLEASRSRIIELETCVESQFLKREYLIRKLEVALNERDAARADAESLREKAEALAEALEEIAKHPVFMEDDAPSIARAALARHREGK